MRVVHFIVLMQFDCCMYMLCTIGIKSAFPFLTYGLTISYLIILYTILYSAAAVGKPEARVPYSTISPLCVKGFSKGLKFGPPSSFSTESLKLIMDAAEDIAFTGM